MRSCNLKKTTRLGDFSAHFISVMRLSLLQLPLAVAYVGPVRPIPAAHGFALADARAISPARPAVPHPPPVCRRALTRCALGPDGRPPGPDQAAINKLLVSILIDLVGMATYIVPVAGESADLAWAPVSALLVQYLYGNGILRCRHRGHPPPPRPRLAPPQPG